jgi:hypothetical protein
MGKFNVEITESGDILEICNTFEEAKRIIKDEEERDKIMFRSAEGEKGYYSIRNTDNNECCIMDGFHDTSEVDI